MTSKIYDSITNCRSCGNSDLDTLYSVRSLPIAGIYYSDDVEALDLCTPINMVRCSNCGLIQLRETINPSIYSEYSFSGLSADAYRKHLLELATFLIDSWNIRNMDVFEVGASDGLLLEYLQAEGQNSVSGVEPSTKLCESASHRGVVLDNTYFNKEYAQLSSTTFDCIIIRHVLEHIDDLNDFVDAVGIMLKEEGLLVVEVPSIQALIDNMLFSNIFQEHLNYFEQTSLNDLLLKIGFIPVYERIVDVHGGSLLSFFKKDVQINSKTEKEQQPKNNWSAFAQNANQYYSEIYQKINTLNRAGKIVHGFGASHRTFILMGSASIDHAQIPIIYDNNTFLQGKRMNGVHSLILPPDKLETERPDAIIIFATSYEDEIRKYLLEECDFDGEIISLKSDVL